MTKEKSKTNMDIANNFQKAWNDVRLVEPRSYAVACLFTCIQELLYESTPGARNVFVEYIGVMKKRIDAYEPFEEKNEDLDMKRSTEPGNVVALRPFRAVSR